MIQQSEGTGPRAGLRLIPDFESWPRLVAAAATFPGKLALVGVFALMDAAMGSSIWAERALVLMLVTFWPGARAPVLLAAALVWNVALQGVGWGTPSQILHAEGIETSRLPWPAWCTGPCVFLVVMCGAAVYVALADRVRRGPLKRPITTWLALYVAYIGLASYAPMPFLTRIALWSVAVVWGQYLWFVGYTLLDLNSPMRGSLTLQAAFWRPFWGGGHVPIPKGASYLRKIEARTPEELAVTQLKGVKLLFWTVILARLQMLAFQVVYGPTLAIPQFASTLAAYLHGTPPGRLTCWASVSALFIFKLIEICVWGHAIVAVCRMAGYRALRNTYRPLEATSLADFYNRYYYYYKELLVHFFFFPTYTRYFRTYPRLRLFFATFVAAGLGNFLYHFLRDIRYIMALGLVEAAVRSHVLFLYCLALSVCLTISQWRDLARARARQPRVRSVGATVAVLVFFGLSSIFDDPSMQLSIIDYGSYLINLFVNFPR